MWPHGLGNGQLSILLKDRQASKAQLAQALGHKNDLAFLSRSGCLEPDTAQVILIQ